MAIEIFYKHTLCTRYNALKYSSRIIQDLYFFYFIEIAVEYKQVISQNQIHSSYN